MSGSQEVINASEAARRVGITIKALRLYERHGLIRPIRTAAGWRTYGAAEMTRAAEIVALRALGLSLAQVGRVMKGSSEDLAQAFATHQAALESRVRQLADTIETVRRMRAALALGSAPPVSELTRLVRPANEVMIGFNLPWPWGGERFELRDIRSLNWIIGPLGSGKTRLAHAIADNLPTAIFVGLERLTDGSIKAYAEIGAEPALKAGVENDLKWLAEEGAEISAALVALVVALKSAGSASLVIDMIEQGLNQATQEALGSYLRQHYSGASSLFVLTRSSAILDLAVVGADESIILCPANHSPPTCVAPYVGAPGYEAVATCLASPQVRSRTEGVVAMRPQVA